jgi:hypothetical protein
VREKLHRTRSLSALAEYFDERAAAAAADAAARRAVKNRLAALREEAVWREAAKVVRLMLPADKQS